jgi:DNA mismatch repair protein MutS2
MLVIIFASYEYPKLVSRICTILEAASNESLVLIDEICSGTDPSYGAALSTCILQLIMLIQVTWKDKDSRFENAAMEFSLQTLRSKY